MTHRAGGEFHGPLGHASSDISEIASRQQNFWGISRPSGSVSGISRALSSARSHRNRSDKGSQRSPGRRVDARSIGQRFRALAALSGPVKEPHGQGFVMGFVVGFVMGPDRQPWGGDVCKRPGNDF